MPDRTQPMAPPKTKQSVSFRLAERGSDAPAVVVGVPGEYVAGVDYPLPDGWTLADLDAAIKRGAPLTVNAEEA